MYVLFSVDNDFKNKIMFTFGKHIQRVHSFEEGKKHGYFGAILHINFFSHRGRHRKKSFDR